MIGQKKLLERLDYLIENNKIPRFFIIEGAKGSGKDLIVKYISNKLCQMTQVDKSIASIRGMIKTSYSVLSPIIYHILESEKMSLPAMNSLLKIVEEPPRLAYFVLTVDNLDSILSTIRSRAVVFNVYPYSKTEIRDYASTLPRKFVSNELEIIEKICKTPGDVNNVLDLDIEAYWSYLTLVFNKIGIWTGVESFKVTSKLKFKEDGAGYDPDFFLSSLATYSFHRMAQLKATDGTKCVQTIALINKYRKEFKIKSINKSASFDMFLLELRDIWRD